MSLSLIAVVAVVTSLALVMSAATRGADGAGSGIGPSPPPDFVDIHDVPRNAPPVPGPGASTGTFTEDCGRNAEGHRNADNLVTGRLRRRARAQQGTQAQQHEHHGPYHPAAIVPGVAARGPIPRCDLGAFPHLSHL
ncbi:hypothetical protein [Actinacidiphila sp. bgisy167]|uniref:hypothetical protein n=1 Tax=Actinacidiphila sp. bgisy167 TaxID=3413797 RepID=UPI003D728675